MKFIKRKRLTKSDVKKMDLSELIKSYIGVNDELRALKTKDTEYLNGLYKEYERGD